MEAILVLFCFGILLFCILKAFEPNTSLADFIKDVFDLHKTPTAQPKPSSLRGQNRYRLYDDCGTDYESFANIVWTCINSLQRKFHLACPANISGIYAAEIADRVNVNSNGEIVFYYEISLSEIMYGGGMKRVTPMLDTQELAGALSRNLPSYLQGGYYFRGAVYVWDIGNNTYRIEIEGVAREPNAYMGDIIL